MGNKLVRNEQVKLTATYLNGMSMAVIGVGCFTPIVAMTLSTGPLPPATLVMASGCIAISFSLHLLAKLALRRLEE